MERHFVATVYVVARINGEKKTLLVLHRKLAKWLAPGGHVDCRDSASELPHEAALREVSEETGLDVVFSGIKAREFEALKQSYAQTVNSGNELLFNPPNHIQLEEIKAGEHYHIDLVYFAKASADSEVVLQEKEAREFKWFDEQALSQAVKDGFMWPNTAFFAAQALKEVGV